MKRDRGRAATRVLSPRASRPATAYLAECLWAGVTEADIAEADARARSATRSSATHYSGALFVPRDDVVFFFFEGPSLSAVQRAAKRARIPSDRILETRRWGQER